MGLYASFNVADYGLVSSFDAVVADMVPVFAVMDWAPACEAFVETFIAEATALVPVRTGYLQSTINAYTDGYNCHAEATADYAEYVEYGTSYMEAQPYFEPALEKAMQAFWEVVEDIQDQEKANIADEVSMELDAMMGSLTDFIMIMMIMLIIALIMTIIDEMFEDIFGVPAYGDPPEVIII